MNTFDGRCGSCVSMNTNDYVRTKDHCKCTYRGQYYDLNEPKCCYYKYDENKDYYDLNHRWYVVTAIFDKLGLKDDYECISLLHNFRNNVLSKDSRYDDVLAEYDIVGPKIAEMLSKDEESDELCKKLVQVFLCRVLDYIKVGKNDEALGLYIEMINLLKVIYNVNIIDNENSKKLILK